MYYNYIDHRSAVHKISDEIDLWWNLLLVLKTISSFFHPNSLTELIGLDLK